MSYQQFTQHCLDCKKEWNASFGVVGTAIIAEAPTQCPFCRSERIEKSGDGWIDSSAPGIPIIQPTFMTIEAVEVDSLREVIPSLNEKHGDILRRLIAYYETYHCEITVTHRATGPVA